MNITARVLSAGMRYTADVATCGKSRSLAVPAKPDASGSAVNGGEFLLLALATCYCNDFYREAARMDITLTEVEVEASAKFPGVGLAASKIAYRAQVISPAAGAQIDALLRETDAVAEVHNTIRSGVPVQRRYWAGDDNGGA